MKRSRLFLVTTASALLLLAGCGGGGGGGEESADAVTPPTQVEIYSNDTGLKSVGHLGAPPLLISNETPSPGETMEIALAAEEGTSVTLRFRGNGCGTFADTTQTAPVALTGKAGESGECIVEASHALGAGTRKLTGRFVVTPQSVYALPPLEVEGARWMVGDLPPASTQTDSEAQERAGLPVIDKIEGPLDFINGGTSQFVVESSSGAEIAAILLKIAGYDGYFRIPADSNGSQARFKMRFDTRFFEKLTERSYLVKRDGETAATRDLDIFVVIVDVLNQVSQPRQVTLHGNETGGSNGDVKVSISWDTASDVDLWVTAPDGTRTWYGNKRPGNGSILDLDSNPACEMDYVNNENIYWESGEAPAGEYTVTVNMYDSCDAGGASGTVTMIYNGEGSPRVESWHLGATGSSVSFTFVHGSVQSRVSGKVTYEDFPVTEKGLGTSRYLPVRYAKVAVVREHDQKVLAEGSTNGRGEYELTFRNDDPDHPEYRVAVYAEQDNDDLKLAVKTPGGKTYAFFSEDTVNAASEPQKSGFDLKIPKSKNAAALNIFDVGVTCLSTVRAGSSMTLEHLDFFWAPGNKTGTYYATRKNQIWLISQANDEDGYDDIVIGHEIGHFVMEKVSVDDSKGGYHTIYTRDTPTRAWSEGWATFFANLSFERSYYVDTDGNGRAATYYSVEYLPKDIPLGLSSDALSGDVSEAVVNAILWDLYDRSNETDVLKILDDQNVSDANESTVIEEFFSDDLSGKDTAIWHILKYLKRNESVGTQEDVGYTGVDLYDFVEAWYCLGFEKIETSDASAFYDIYAGLHRLKEITSDELKNHCKITSGGSR